ncbi:MAG: hypothetical protein AAF384_02000 [Pseudomonadota bacterium]
MITVHAEFHSHFKEIATVSNDSFELETNTVSEFAEKVADKYGPQMRAMLLDPETKDLNAKGTMYVDTKGRRIFIDDTLEDGETIAFLVGIAGG